jgi:hypothetical protein
MLEMYSSERFTEWDSFIEKSYPGSVIHKRKFIEYHSDRFTDASIIYRNVNGDVIAVIPGNTTGTEWFSHKGLTFGGLITDLKNPRIFTELVTQLDLFLINKQFSTSTFILPSESFYPDGNSAQIYSLHQNGYQLATVEINQVLPHTSNLASKKLSNARSAIRRGLEYSENDSNIEQVHQIIETNLERKYLRKPVHTIEEIRYLQQTFPELIKVCSVNSSNQVLAGAITFESRQCIHIQYMGATIEGRSWRAQDLLISQIWNKATSKGLNLSFGKSTAGLDSELNAELFNFKKEFGSTSEVSFTFKKIFI